jgi:hypothetical protein
LRDKKEIMYILSNGVKISEKMHQRLCRAIKDTSGKYFYFLDMETGKLISIPRSHRRKLALVQRESQRFVPLPKVSKEERRKRFVAFVEELGVIDVPKLQARLSKEIKKGTSLEELEKILEKDPSGWIHGWVQDEQFLLAERIEGWITKPPLNARDDPDYWYDDNCPVCQLMRKMEEENRSPTLSEMRQAFKKAKNQGGFVGGELLREDDEKEEGLEFIGTADNFKIPKWMECTWRRNPCGRDDCPICGRIKRDRQRHIEKGEDPDDLKSIFEDISWNFKEVLEMIEKDAESKGFDITNIENIKEPPENKEFSLYVEVEKWNKSVMALGDIAQATGEFWIYTEEAADLFWYANILMAKTYRQLCNRWHIENGDDYGHFDYQYTSYVLKECLKILKKSLKEIVKNNQPQRIELNLILSELLKLEKEIIKI